MYVEKWIRVIIIISIIRPTTVQIKTWIRSSLWLSSYFGPISSHIALQQPCSWCHTIEEQRGSRSLEPQEPQEPGAPGAWSPRSQEPQEPGAPGAWSPGSQEPHDAQRCASRHWVSAITPSDIPTGTLECGAQSNARLLGQLSTLVLIVAIEKQLKKVNARDIYLIFRKTKHVQTVSPCLHKYSLFRSWNPPCSLPRYFLNVNFRNRFASADGNGKLCTTEREVDVITAHRHGCWVAVTRSQSELIYGIATSYLWERGGTNGPITVGREFNWQYFRSIREGIETFGMASSI